MPTIGGYFARVDSDSDAQPLNGATVKIWLDNASFAAATDDGVLTYPPISGTAVPVATTNKVGANITTGVAHGGVGAWRKTGLSAGSYYVSFEYSTDDTVWEYHEALLTGGTGTDLAITPTTGKTLGIGSTTCGDVTVESDGYITIGNAGCGAVSIQPAGAGAVFIGSTTSSAITIKSNTYITVGNAECEITSIIAGTSRVDLVAGGLTLGTSAGTVVPLVWYGSSASDYAATITPAEFTAARAYTLPDAGGAASFVMTAGAQTLTGALDLSSTLDLNSTTGGLRLVAAGANRIHGTGTLASGATTTTINNSAIKAGARVIFEATSANFWVRDPFVSTITADTSFVITHLNQANTPTFAYWIINPVA